MATYEEKVNREAGEVLLCFDEFQEEQDDAILGDQEDAAVAERRSLSFWSERFERHYNRTRNIANNNNGYARWRLRYLFDIDTGEPDSTRRTLIDQYYPILYGEAYNWDDAAHDEYE
jgi:hypothetical protein